MREIEAGCLAVVVNMKGNLVGLNGKSVTAVCYLGDVYCTCDHPNCARKFLDENFWEVDIDIPTNHGINIRALPEENLLRIDGFDEQELLDERVELAKSA